MTFYQLTLGGLLLGLPLVGFAQETRSVLAPELYVGVAVYSGPYQRLDFTNIGASNSNIPVQVTVGYQLRPRLAVQLGLAYSGNKYTHEYEYDFTDTNTNQIHYNTTSTYTLRTFDTALLLRYTLTRTSTHRFQTDLVGGFQLTHQRARRVGTDNYSYVNPSQGIPVSVEYDEFYRYNVLNVDLGPSFRYRFGQRLEAVGDLIFNLPVTGNYHGLDSSLALGLRYHFGQ